jgi:glycosyltransferase involved in cell wall biosynthesis
MQNTHKLFNFNLVICTYSRPQSLFKLLKSIQSQTIYPDKILIVDSSIDDNTESILKNENYKNVEYFRVGSEHRGLTKQRNFGVNKVTPECEIICFLDDDIVLSSNYFEELLKTYKIYSKAIGASGYIIGETNWKQLGNSDTKYPDKFYYDGWYRTEGSRFSMRRKFGLAPDRDPGFMPNFSHGYSTGFLPPSGKIYKAEMLMGGLASYRVEVFKHLSFSSYFEGYGLYEDADFSLRASKIGQLYVNTAATLEHHHDQNSRPDQFKYGKMVLRNGWYVWRVKYPEPSIKAKLKWHSTALLLTVIRFLNVITTNEKRKAFSESLGRLYGWISLFTNAPNRKAEE